MTEQDLKNAILIADTFVNNLNNGNISINDFENKGCLDIKYPGEYDATIQFYKEENNGVFKYRILNENFIAIKLSEIDKRYCTKITSSFIDISQHTNKELLEKYYEDFKSRRNNMTKERLVEIENILNHELDPILKKYPYSFKNEDTINRLLHEIGYAVVNIIRNGVITTLEVPYIEIIYQIGPPIISKTIFKYIRFGDDGCEICDEIPYPIKYMTQIMIS